MRGRDGTEIKVRLMQRRADSSYYFEVRVRSVVKPNLIRIGIVEYREDARIPQKIAALAGALAEELDERYHDTIEPSAAAATALECYRELMAKPYVNEGTEPPRDATGVEGD
jgi:hypothetical protein